MPVTLKEAVLGAKVKVPTPRGPVMLTIPKGTTSGKVFRLKGKGFTGKDGKRGDQLVTVAIDDPAGDEALAKFAEGWERRRQPARGAGRLGVTVAHDVTFLPNRPRPGASGWPACSRGLRARQSSERIHPRADGVGSHQAGRQSGCGPTGSSTPATWPICRCWRCFPSSFWPRRSPNLFGQSQDAQLAVFNILRRLAATASQRRCAIRSGSAQARTGPLLWFGAIVGLWTAASFIETIRDILRRAYGVKYCAPFWEYRLGSILLILGAVMLLMIAFALERRALSSMHHHVARSLFPRFAPGLAARFGLYRLVPAADHVRHFLRRCSWR